MSTETLRQALKDCLDWMESLRACGDAGNWEWGAASEYARGIAALEAKDEPWEKFCDSHCVWTDHHPDCKLAQRTWVGLTDEEVKQSYRQKCSEFGHWLDERAFLIACRWAEVKLKEKNT